MRSVYFAIRSRGIFKFALTVMGLALVGLETHAHALTATGKPVVVEQMSTKPLAFTANLGQWDESVHFQAHAEGMTIWFTRDGVVYQSLRRVETDSDARVDVYSDGMPGSRAIAPTVESYDAEQQVVRSIFENAHPDPTVMGEQLAGHKCNYFIGSDPSEWYTDIPSYNRIVYHDLYPGIDVVFYGNDGKLEYDFIVHPGADHESISLRYDGVQHTGLDRNGDLILVTAWGEMSHHVPLIYQVGPDGRKQPMSGGFCLSDDGLVKLDIPGARSSELALVIDPILSYSTFLGGGSSELSGAITVDATGAAYVGGATVSTDFPILNEYSNTIAGASDAYITKLSPSGSPVYSTYIGGTLTEYLSGIAVDGLGSVYVTGMAFSSDFPLQSAYDGSYNGGQTDVFITKISPAGNALTYSTFFGGSANDQAPAIAVDASGAAYVTGKTISTDLPVQNAYSASFNGGLYDAFVVKLTPAGNTLDYSTFLGGDNWDFGYAIAIDASGNAYVAGSTLSTNFPMLNAYDNSHNLGVYDIFVTKLSTAGNQLVYSTFLGGSSFDEGFGIDVDASGSVYVTGRTESIDFPLQNPYDASHNGGEDAFVTKFTPSGSALVFSTYLGGSNADVAHGIAVDPSNHAYVLGRTISADFPTQDPFDNSYNGGRDLFVAKLTGNGSGLHYSTYLGGTSQEHPDGFEITIQIAVDGSGAAYVTGTTQSSDYPTQSAYDASIGGGLDAFVTRLSPGAFDTLQFTAYSPVDIIVINPTGTDSIGPGFNTFGTQATYDSSNDYGIGANGIPGENDDRVCILQAVSGEWVIRIVPEIDADTSDNYFLGIRDPGGNYNGYVSMTNFAENTQSLMSSSPVANQVPPQGSYATTSAIVATQRRGDLNGDNIYNVQDVTLTINIAFRSAVPPEPQYIADVNGDGVAANVLDVVRIIGTAFRGQLEPGP